MTPEGPDIEKPVLDKAIPVGEIVKKIWSIRAVQNAVIGMGIWVFEQTVRRVYLAIVERKKSAKPK